MKIKAQSAFTIVEMMVAVSIGAMLLAGAIGAAVALQKSFSAADRFFSTHVQQVRIIDYVGRDVKRAVITTVSTDNQTITCQMPTYLKSTGARMTPVVFQTTSGTRVNYGRLAVISTTANSTTITSSTANFTAADVGSVMDGVPQAPVASGPPTVITITAVASSTTATISSAATATLTDLETTISPVSTAVYSVVGNTIVRTQTDNATAQDTMIASSTDQLIEKGTDVTDDLKNTEYLDANVTFLPAFNFAAATNPDPSATPDAATTAKRNGTAVYGRAYLRNKRRG